MHAQAETVACTRSRRRQCTQLLACLKILSSASTIVYRALRADPGHTVMGELTLFGAAANTAGFEAAIHMVRADICR